MSKTVGLLFFPKNGNVFFSPLYGFLFHGARATEFRGCSVNPLSAERFEPELAAGVATRLEPPPVVRGAPIPVFLAPQTVDVRALAAKMRESMRTRPAGVLLDAHACRASMHSQRHTISAEQGFAHRQKRIFVFFVRQERFSRAARSQKIPENCAL
jgi:hypothetical protein